MCIVDQYLCETGQILGEADQNDKFMDPTELDDKAVQDEAECVYRDLYGS